jgi:hypothetical protein
LAKPHDDLGVSLGVAPTRAKQFAKPVNRVCEVCVGVAMAVLAGHVLAQPAPQTSAEQEQRRAQERETQIREQQERGRDVRLPAPASIATERLPEGESPCFRITHIQLQSPVAKDLARFTWLTQALAGNAEDDGPVGKCLGARAMDVVLKRANDAVIARGFVTSRVLIAPQDLSSGTLVLTVLPGRIHAIRFAEPVDPRATAWNAVPAKPGDILNVRDIEQALENFQRVPLMEQYLIDQGYARGSAEFNALITAGSTLAGAAVGAAAGGASGAGTLLWIEAGKLLAEDPAALISCPVCANENLRVTDHRSTETPSVVEREMRCLSCGARNYLRLVRPLDIQG